MDFGISSSNSLHMSSFDLIVILFLVSRLISDLNTRLKAAEYDIVVRIVTFLTDLGNARVLTYDSIVEFLLSFIEQAAVQNLLSDFYVYSVMHTLPWIGGALFQNQLSTLEELMTKLESRKTTREDSETLR
ncbi:80 kDa nuclear cap-binding protein [Aphelenchoides besseyi]|nr:80 kDa nuclear cap-binding protein [Aphelenchoides besseyi]